MVNNTMENQQPTHFSKLDHNVFVPWKQEYSLDIPILDEQHRAVFTIINSLYYGMQNKYTGNILVPIIGMVTEYTSIHFQLEEHLLTTYGFPNVAKHKEYHRDLMAKLSSLGKQSLTDKDPYPMMDFLKKYWINHICKCDKEFGVYLIQ